MSKGLRSSLQPAPTAVPLSVAASFGTSGLGGVLGWIVVHPFNTLSVRMNLVALSEGGSGTKLPSFIPFARNTVQKDGFRSLYSGLSAGVTRQIFYATSRFGLYEVFRDQMVASRGGTIDIQTRLIAGSSAGAAAAFIACPAEVSLVRMSNDANLPEAKRRNYKGVADAGMRIASEEGAGALWRGVVPFAQRAMLVGAAQVATYDQFREMFFKGFGLNKNGVANVFCASMSAGLLYSVVTNPFETAKNRMAFQTPQADGTLLYRGTFNTMRTVAAQEGTLALWNGFIPYYLRCGGHTVAMFLAVEESRKLYLQWNA